MAALSRFDAAACGLLHRIRLAWSTKRAVYQVVRIVDGSQQCVRFSHSVQPLCPEQLRLTRVYAEALRKLSETVLKYAQSSPAEQSGHLRQDLRKANQVVEAALSELDKHMAEHGC